MIDLAYIREHLDEIKAAVRDLNSSAPLDEIVELDERRRAMLSEIESLRAERNRVSREIPRIKDAEEKAALITQMRGVGDRIAELEKELDPVQERLQQALLEVPNLPDPSVPVGPDESHNVVVRQVGELPTFDFEPLPHWDLGETASSISSAVSRSRALAFTSSRAPGPDCSGLSSPG